ncbi:sporulation protein [Tissierella creatinini]|nr:sporulation protein [Tissierella creatinini]TJX60113.1 sporulation protein [Soehngenia saccharolytica]
MSEYSVNESISNIFARLEEFIKTKTVVGEPMQIGDVTIVPFVEISFAVGTGGGSGVEEKGNQGSGGGAGSGGKVSPTAVLVIKGDKVELLPINKTANLERLVQMVPDIVGKIKTTSVDKNDTSTDTVEETE